MIIIITDHKCVPIIYLEYFSPVPLFWECDRTREIAWTVLVGQRRSRRAEEGVCAVRWRRTWFVPLRRMKSSSALRGMTPPAAVCPEIVKMIKEKDFILAVGSIEMKHISLSFNNGWFMWNLTLSELCPVLGDTNRSLLCIRRLMFHNLTCLPDKLLRMRLYLFSMFRRRSRNCNCHSEPVQFKNWANFSEGMKGQQIF